MLRLTPFEEYMYRDDRDGYPMAFFIRLRFSGVLDRAAVRRAYRSTTARHPLLRSVVSRDEKDRCYWTQTDKSPEFLAFDTNDPEWMPRSDGLDLAQKPGIRLYHIVRGGKTDRERVEAVTDLLFQVHHACCDGIALVQMIDDFLHLYMKEREIAEMKAAPAPDPKALKRRDRPARRFSWLLKTLRIVPSQFFCFMKFARTYVTKPTPLVPMTVEKQEEKPGGNALASSHRVYGITMFHAMKDKAKRIGVTLNDLLTRDLFLVLNRFRNKYYFENREKPIRLAVPVNLRPLGRGNGHVANVVGLTFVDRNPNETRPESLLADIHREMTGCKRFFSCLTFGYVLRFCRMIPGLLAAEVRRKRKVWASCVFSNLGPVFSSTDLPRRHGRIRCGGAVLRDVVFLPPIRAWTAVSIGMATYDGSMSIGLHYDSRFLSRSQAEELQDMLHEQLVSDCT